MKLVSRIVPLLVVLLVGLMGGRAEASRMDFQGIGKQGAVVWDGNGDVSTMAAGNDCFLTSSPCASSLFGSLPTGFGVRVSLTNPGDSLADVSIDAIHILLSSSDFAGSPCGASPDVTCANLSDFAFLSDTGWAVRADNTDASGLVAISTQPIIRLLTQSVAGDPTFYALTAGSLAFLATLDPAILAASHVGIDVGFATTGGDSGNTPFSVATAAPSVPVPTVPEPGTLLLLGSGLAVAARARRRALR